MADIESGLWGDYTGPSAYQSSTSKTNTTNTDVYKEYKTDLDKNAFLNLLLTQLKYQDPLNPMENKDFIAQMAQFSALEQMTNMTAALTKSQGFSMIGKVVTASTFNEKTNLYEEATGKVESVVSSRGSTYLTVNTGKDTKLISIGDVTEVWEDYDSNEQLHGIYNTVTTSQILSLVGKTIQAITQDEKGNPTGFVEGKVEYIKFNGSTPIIMVGDKEVYGYEVLSVADDKMLIGKTINIDLGEEGGITPGTVTEVIFKGQVPTIVIESEGVERLVPVRTLNYVSEAMRYVNKSITVGDLNGKVEGIIIRSGQVYMMVNNGTELKEISYEALRNQTAGE